MLVPGEDDVDADNLEQALNEFKMLVTLQIQLMAVELVRAEEPLAIPVVMGESTTAIAAELAALRQQATPETATAELPRSRARANRPPAVVEESKKTVSPGTSRPTALRASRRLASTDSSSRH